MLASAVAVPVQLESDIADMKAKRKLTTIRFVQRSQLPYRLERKKDGVLIGSFESQEAAIARLSRCTLQELNPVVRRRGRIVRGG